MKTFRQQAFSLIELMVTIAIVGILLLIGLPNMSDFIKNERLTSQINSLNSHLQFARNESVTRNSQVIVCSSSSGSTCSGNWKDGWIIFVDKDANDSLSDGDEIIKVHEALTGGTTLVSSGGSTIIYDNRGFSPNSSSTFSICDDRGASKGKAISISNTGRIRLGGTVSCS